MGQLVHWCGREPVACAQAANESGREEQRGIVMDRRIAEVSGEWITAMLRANTLEVLFNLRECFIPTDALPASGGAADGMFEAVFVVVNIL